MNNGSVPLSTAAIPDVIRVSAQAINGNGNPAFKMAGPKKSNHARGSRQGNFIRCNATTKSSPSVPKPSRKVVTANGDSSNNVNFSHMKVEPQITLSIPKIIQYRNIMPPV